MIESRAPRRMRHSWEARCRLVQLVLDGTAPAQAAVVCGASRATAYRVLGRYRTGGWEALRDRAPIARSHPARLSAEAERQIVELRRTTGWGPKRLAGVLGWPAATIWRVLRRHGISRRAAAPRPPANRYEYAAPGELVHLDIKQLGRFWQVGKRALGTSAGKRNREAGWSYLHLAVDDHSRYAVAQLRPTQTSSDAVAFLEHALERFAAHGIQVQRIMSDNGSCYVGNDLRRAVEEHGLRHIRTRPYTPRTNGKAEALIGILLREWAYAYIWHSSAHRARALTGYIRWYNTHRAHGTTGAPPITRISQAQGSYT
jgi:transposase InsO family protein